MAIRDTYSYFLLLWPGDPKPYGLARTDMGIIQRWQPESKEWIPAPWQADELYGEHAYKESRAIAKEEAEALIVAGTFTYQIPEHGLKFLWANR